MRYAFRDMRVLAQKVDSLSINNLAFTDTFKHLPENDDIKLVANALQKMSTLLDEQVSDIKQFVADASHELRTPLMILRSSSELAHKTQQYDALYDKQQTTIKRMEGLIDALLALSRGEMIE